MLFWILRMKAKRCKSQVFWNNDTRRPRA
jgi:hypothetical protein